MKIIRKFSFMKPLKTVRKSSRVVLRWLKVQFFIKLAKISKKGYGVATDLLISCFRDTVDHQKLGKMALKLKKDVNKENTSKITQLPAKMNFFAYGYPDTVGVT